jgi:LacI family transcriptional regulator
MRAGRRITIREVARAAGVSTQTVSRVLNGRPDVSPETFERVQQVIRETGYAPNMFARGLTQGRSHTLGVVAFGLDYFGPSRVLTGIESQAAELGYAISLNLIHQPATGDISDLLNSLLARQVDGIIWAIPEVGDNRAWSHVLSADPPVPVVLVGGMAGRSTLPAISIDNRAIGRLATRHLLAGGARHVGLISGPAVWWESVERRLGWLETLVEEGRDADALLVVEGDWSASSGEAGLEELLRLCPDMDAVFASNDLMALGAMHAAHRLGLRIPQDLSVAGVDDMMESSHFWPPLTTVHQPLRDAGVRAVEELDRVIHLMRQPGHAHDHQERTATLLTPELIVRGSTRPV